MKTIQYHHIFFTKIPLCFMLFMVSSYCIAQEVSDQETQAEQTDSETSDVANNVDISAPEEENSGDATLDNSDIDNSDMPLQKPVGPTVGFVPEMAIVKYQQQLQNHEAKKDHEKLYQFAYQQQSRGLLNSAQNAYQELLLADPKHQKARISLARLQIANKNYNEAITNLNIICQKSDAHWLAWYWKGLAELLTRQYDFANSSLQQVLIREPENSAAWLLRALVEQERNDHHTALQLLSIAMQHDSQNPTLYLNMAISYEATGNPDAAFDMYSRYLKLAGHSDKSKTLNKSILHRLGEMNIANND